MLLPRFPRLEALFGTSLESINEHHVSDVVDGTVDEASDLDFKSSLYGGSDAEKRDLATDVAAIANASGGLIALGIKEENGKATASAHVELSETTELAMKQVIASHVFPFPETQVLQVPTAADPKAGYYLIVVSPSSWKPHGVKVNEGFRYPIRDGRSNRYLSESEIANAYRNRFQSAQSRVHRLEEIEGEGLKAIEADKVWLTASLVPDQLGAMTIDFSTVDSVRDWATSLQSRRTAGPNFLWQGVGIEVRPGRRRIVLENPGFTYAELHADGSSFAAYALAWNHDHDRWLNEKAISIFDESLALNILALTRLVVAHAVHNAGTRGDALAHALLTGSVVTDDSKVVFEKALVYSRRGFLSLVPNTRIITHAGTAESMLNLDEVYASPAGWVAAARLLMKDLVQAFGLAEPYQFTADGDVRKLYFVEGVAWAEDLGISVSEEKITT